MNRAGFGELCSMFTAPADWYLASAVGLETRGTRASSRCSAMARRACWMAPLASPPTTRRCSPSWPAHDPDGIAMGVAGRTAPLSRHRAPVEPPARHGRRPRWPAAWPFTAPRSAWPACSPPRSGTTRWTTWTRGPDADGAVRTPRSCRAAGPRRVRPARSERPDGRRVLARRRPEAGPLARAPAPPWRPSPPAGTPTAPPCVRSSRPRTC